MASIKSCDVISTNTYGIGVYDATLNADRKLEAIARHLKY